ncbi:hypothetical protein [Amycolatopsis jiangsuensis]|uniref:Uncharacterized protein n=1 Tax=Amycolatopsis jiangsuensis TaxID=1181879 RepID=A0A840J270_9PSEU|nr:hypothetical protein [Amycolatopsis jiangsuensis]MBB4689106.1 hypothetical protein [Amycolatopsis jiangsuensis]
MSPATAAELAAASRHRLTADFVHDHTWSRLFRSGLRLTAEGLRVRFGPWLVTTPLTNLAGAEVTGPLRAVRALGVRLSLSDRGLTFGTSTENAVCLRFREPVPGIEPWGLLKHPNLTVTCARPELVALAVQRITEG